MSRIDEATRLWNNGRSCAQAVAEAFAPSVGLSPQAARAVARGFGSGMGQGGRCGALTGAVIVLGLAAEGEGDEAAARQAVYPRVRAITQSFEARCGSSSCRELLDGLDPGVPEQREEARARGLFDTVCPACVRAAAALLEAELG